MQPSRVGTDIPSMHADSASSQSLVGCVSYLVVHGARQGDASKMAAKHAESRWLLVVEITLITIVSVERSCTRTVPLTSIPHGHHHHHRPVDDGRVLRNHSSLQSLHLAGKMHVPQYMLDLYEASQKSSKDIDDGRHESSVVRSYINVDSEYRKQSYMQHGLHGNFKTSVYSLAFDVSPMASGEAMDYAELRLHALVSRDRLNYAGVDRRVSVFMVHVAHNGSLVHGLLDSKHVYQKSQNAWETFDVTKAVVTLTSGHQTEQQQLRLEVRIASPFFTVGHPGQLDVDVSPFVETEPLLLVYSSSNAIRKRTAMSPTKPHARSKRQAVVSNDVVDDGDDVEEETNVIAEDKTASKTVTKSRRRKHRNPCRRKPMFVNFTEINYDTWIIAPRGYEAYECGGKCYFPLSDHLTPTEHAVIQTLVHTLAPKKAARACCVPTVLDSISILYLDKDGVVTYKYRHENMVVIECGCR